MKAVQQLALAGLHAGVNCAPVLPQITDSQPGTWKQLVRSAAEAGAAFVFSNALFLKPCAKKRSTALSAGKLSPSWSGPATSRCTAVVRITITLRESRLRAGTKTLPEARCWRRVNVKSLDVARFGIQMDCSWRRTTRALLLLEDITVWIIFLRQTIRNFH